MKNLSLKYRAAFYNLKFPKWKDSHLHVETGRWLSGIWILGNDYKSKNKYHGEYPPNYMNRVSALFPDAKKVLHLFSGSLEKSKKHTTFDLDVNNKLNPDVQGDANQLSEYFKKDEFDLIYADPPYTEEDANKYGTTLVNRNKVLKECHKILQPGGYVVWLDQILPMFRKDMFEFCGVIGLVRSTNHRVRGVFIFKRI